MSSGIKNANGFRHMPLRVSVSSGQHQDQLRPKFRLGDATSSKHCFAAKVTGSHRAALIGCSAKRSFGDVRSQTGVWERDVSNSCCRTGLQARTPNFGRAWRPALLHTRIAGGIQSSRLISLRSQTRENCHSRFTVATEIPSALAVSSILSPVK